MYLLPFTCAHCGKAATQSVSAVNRARKIGAPLYCNKTCAGAARRANKTMAQKVEEKRIYDAARRIREADRLRVQKAAYHQRTYDPAKAAVVRAARMPRHIEYCRQPAYRAWKTEYDLRRRAAEFGEFSEAYLLALEVNREIKQRMTRDEIYQERGRLNGSTKRKRAAAAGTVALG
jgi:hypothetical protein